MLCLAAGLSKGQVVFSDDFDNGPAKIWGNERGQWSFVNGEYFASQPSNSPCTYTSLPFEQGDMEFECDVLAANDGGIWLHTNPQGTTGVLFVLARGDAYWHTVVNNTFSPILNPAGGAFSIGQNVHVRISVIGNTYRAYLNHSPSPITTLSTDSFPSGRAGLYDFTAGMHRFDNVVLSGSCIGGDCCAYNVESPEPVTICPHGTAQLHTEGAGSSVNFTWEYEIIAGEWYQIEDGPNFDGDTFLFNATGAHTGDIALDRGSGIWDRSFNVRAVASNSCSSDASDPASISLCPPDFDCSGFSDLDDYIAFVAAFEAGTDDADFDGSGFVDTDDFTAFVLSFEAGC